MKYVITIVRKQRKQRLKLHKNGKQTSIPRAQLQLLRQSVLVFLLYTVSCFSNKKIDKSCFQASILCVFALSFARPSVKFPAFDIAFLENLLNLSIAAVYPICFLSTSGEMRRFLFFSFFRSSLFVGMVRKRHAQWEELSVAEVSLDYVFYCMHFTALSRENSRPVVRPSRAFAQAATTHELGGMRSLRSRKVTRIISEKYFTTCLSIKKRL